MLYLLEETLGLRMWPWDFCLGFKASEFHHLWTRLNGALHKKGSSIARAESYFLYHAIRIFR
jgi:hypothetical protein